MFVKPGDDLYVGMIVGENARDNDMVVNPVREKKLTNMRAAGADENVILKPPRDMSLEAAESSRRPTRSGFSLWWVAVSGPCFSP